MTILVDFSPTVMSNIYMQMDNISDNGEIKPMLVKHMIFDSLRSIIRTHSAKYGEPVICMDTWSNWRKKEFVYYKANRKKAQAEKTHIDWDAFYGVINQAKEDVKNNLPYLSIEVPEAEADDIIGTLSRYLFETNPKEKILIISNDTDFKQLQRYPTVVQYSNQQDKFVKSKYPLAELKEKILRGDKGDGIPNIRADEDVFMDDAKRSPPISAKKLAEVLVTPDDQMHTILSESELKAWNRNKTLIDLSNTPMHIQKNIIDAYRKREIKGSMIGLMNFFSENRMNVLGGKVQEFRNLKL